jgi:hypothetical protein
MLALGVDARLHAHDATLVSRSAKALEHQVLAFARCDRERIDVGVRLVETILGATTCFASSSSRNGREAKPQTPFTSTRTPMPACPSMRSSGATPETA